MWQELGFVPSYCISSALGSCWWRAKEEDCSCPRLLCGGNWSRQVVRLWIYAEAASDFHRMGEKGGRSIVEKCGCSPAVCLGDKGNQSCTSYCDSIIACASFYSFLGTNWVKFNGLGSMQFLKLRHFHSETHKISNLTCQGCFAHWEWKSGLSSSHSVSARYGKM